MLDGHSTHPEGHDARRLAGALDVLAAQRPDLREARVAVLGSGLDHHAYLVDDLVLRLSADEDDDLQREAALLETVRTRCVVPVPVPVAGTATWMAYPMLDGVPLLDLEPNRRARLASDVAATLGGMLARLWTTSPDEVAELVEDDRTPLSEWRDEAAELAAQLASDLPRSIQPALRRFLEAPLPASAPARVFSHNDLGCEHVLIDPALGRVTGIIDWSDAAIVDPAKDLGLILRDLGHDAFDHALRIARPGFPSHDDPAPRARFYARCLALEDLAFGLETGQRSYTESAHAALTRLLAGDAA